MSVTTDDVFAAATTAAAPPVADANGTEPPKSAESAPAATESGEKPEDLPAKVQSRFDELTRKRYDAERRAEQVVADRDEWRDRALRVEKPAPTAEEPATAGKTLADFGFDEVAYRAHVLKEARSEATQATRAVLTEERQAQIAADRDAEFAEREAEFAKTVPDYFEVTRGNVPITAEMAATIKAVEKGPALALYLGKNPGVAAKLARLPPHVAAVEMGLIIAKLSDVPKPPQVSGAPPPAPKIAPSDVKVDKDPRDWTDKDFANWRKKHM